MWKVKGVNSIQCSLCKIPIIFVEPTPRDKIEILLEEYPHQEWLGYLVGQENKDSGDIFVEDISIPPHEEANGASCLAEAFHIPKKCVGVLHSHHIMGAFHSGQDDQTVDRNFPISITVAKRGTTLEWDAISYARTPCGKHTLLKCSVKYIQPKLQFDKEKFLKEAKENIDKGKKVYIPQQGNIPLTNYNKSNSPSFVVDDKGNVITEKEYKQIMKQIWKD